MTCEHFRSLIEAAYDEKLGWLGRRRFWRHRCECEACRDEYELAEYRIEAARGRNDDGTFRLDSGQMPMARIASHLLRDALKAGASSARLEPLDRCLSWDYEAAEGQRETEPMSDKMREATIEYAGVALPRMPLPKYAAEPLVAMFKAMANLDLRCIDRPQRGSFNVRYDGRTRRVEVAFTPAEAGETIDVTFVD